MDLVLGWADTYFFDSFYPQWIPASFMDHFDERTDMVRQCVSLWIIEMVGIHILYFTLAPLSYYLLFDKSLLNHPKFLKNQIAKEIWMSWSSFPITAAVTVPWFLFEVRGYSKLYHDLSDHSLLFTIWSIVWFILFTDFGVYWIHRYEHHPSVYWWLHKPHHLWKVPTPFASFAFHPLDGYFQSLPMHIYVYLFPMNSYLYLSAFVIIQIWTVSIHDGVYIVSHPWINSSAHHTVHHLEFNYNYGQYFTLWDRIGGSYRRPENEFENEMFFDKISKKKSAIDNENSTSSSTKAKEE